MFIRQIVTITILFILLFYGVHSVIAQTVENPDSSIVIISLRNTLSFERSEQVRNSSTRRMHIRRLQDDFEMRQLRTARDIWRMQTIPMIVARVDNTTIMKLKSDPAVESVQVSRIFMNLTSESSNQIGAQAAHSSGITGVGTSVAILDTGVDGNHIALRGKIIQEACFSTTDRSFGSRSVCAAGASMQTGVRSAKPCNLSIDACTHGTHVAGIVAGRVVTEDGIMTRGIAPDAKIIAVQVFSRFSATHKAAMCGASSSDCVLAYEHDILRALDWIQANYDASTWGTLAAVNISLGDGSYSEPCDSIGGTADYPFKWFIDQLRLNGIATVIAAGNSASNNGVAFPACISSAVSVGSVSSTKPVYGLRDRPSSFTNAPQATTNRPNQKKDRLLDFYAPGEFIRSSVVSSVGQSFAEFSGTSMAAPHVTGAWALIKSIQPMASVPQVYRWLYETGVPIYENRAGFDTTLIVPRINVSAAINRIRNLDAPVVLNAWALDMGDVRVGDVLTQRLTIEYRGVPTTIQMVLSGRYYSVKTIMCEGFVDDLTPMCIFEVTFAPTNSEVGGVNNASIRLVLNSVPYTIGLTGRGFVGMPDVALTQTSEQRATVTSLALRTATRTAWPTPTSHASARTVVAIATRTQRRVDDINRNATQRAIRFAQTATYVASLGGATYTPSITPRATRTTTPLPITNTIAVAKTETQRVISNQTATAWVNATRTQRRSVQTTATAIAVAQTATKITLNGLPTYTATVTRRSTMTSVPTLSPTLTHTQRPTRVPTHSYISTHNIPLYKPYRAIIGSDFSAVAVLLNPGNFSKSIVPELTIVDQTTQQLTATLRLPGIDATALTAVVNRPNQLVVAGRLNWDSMYVQIYEVTSSSFSLVATHVYPLSNESRVTALYATDRRIFVGLATVTPPAKLVTGQLVVFERVSSSKFSEIAVSPHILAGVPMVIRAVDDADSNVITAGYVPNVNAPTGFLQTVRWNINRYESLMAFSRSVPVTDIALYSVVNGLTRMNLIFTAQTNGLGVLQFDESTGLMFQYQITIPMYVTKLDMQSDQIATIGFDSVRRLTVSSVYQWSIDRLILRRFITHANPSGGIVGVTYNQINPIFSDSSWLRFAR